jgi:uroporphyrinogen-III synthase
MISVLISPDSSNHAIAVQLENSGARVVAWPPLDISAPADDSSIREAIDNLFGYDWLIFKNAPAVDYLMNSFLSEHRRYELDDLRVMAIGSEACEKASEFQIHVDIALERFAHHRVHEEIRSYVGLDELPRLNVLVPNAGVSRETFEEQLEAGGARVDSVMAYRTCSNTEPLAKQKALLAGGGIDTIAFTGAASVNEFACVFDTDDLPRLLKGVAVICLDQTTARAASDFGLTQTLVPAEPSVHEVANLIKTIG